GGGGEWAAGATAAGPLARARPADRRPLLGVPRRPVVRGRAPLVTRRVVVLRGTAASPWDLRPWEELGDGYRVEVLVPPNNLYDTTGVRIERVPVATVGGRLPGGRAGALLTRAVGERYLGLEERLAGADIVHGAELGYW